MALGDCPSPKPDSDKVEDADDPRRHEIHQSDQKDAEYGVGRRLRYLIREIGRELDKKCPMKAPEIEAMPPTMLPTSDLIERSTGKLSGET